MWILSLKTKSSFQQLISIYWINDDNFLKANCFQIIAWYSKCKTISSKNTCPSNSSSLRIEFILLLQIIKVTLFINLNACALQMISMKEISERNWWVGVACRQITCKVHRTIRAFLIRPRKIFQKYEIRELNSWM